MESFILDSASSVFNLNGFSKSIEFGTGRFLETNFRQIRRCTPALQHVISFLVIKNKLFYVASSVGTMYLLLYQRRKPSNVHMFSTFHTS